jgi:hypothetical protein
VTDGPLVCLKFVQRPYNVLHFKNDQITGEIIIIIIIISSSSSSSSSSSI